MENIELRTGHSEIVGDYQVVPTKLIAELPNQGLMRPTPVDLQAALDALLARLYLD